MLDEHSTLEPQPHPVVVNLDKDDDEWDLLAVEGGWPQVREQSGRLCLSSDMLNDSHLSSLHDCMTAWLANGVVTWELAQ